MIAVVIANLPNAFVVPWDWLQKEVFGIWWLRLVQMCAVTESQESCARTSCKSLLQYRLILILQITGNSQQQLSSRVCQTTPRDSELRPTHFIFCVSLAVFLA